MTAFFAFMGVVAVVDVLALAFGADSRRPRDGRAV